MTKIIVRLLFLVYFSTAAQPWASVESNVRVTQLLDNLAAKKGLEAVYGDKFPEVNPYGSYGSPHVIDFINFGGIEHSILFLARKRNEFYDKDKDVEDTPGSIDHTLDLVREYDYFLVFAVKESNAESFEVKDVLGDRIRLMGMSLYYGELNLEALRFSYIENNSIIDASTIDRRKLSTAILISALSSNKILFYYDGKWIQHVDIEI